jgi:hypothetical protein
LTNFCLYFGTDVISVMKYDVMLALIEF